MIPLPPDEIHRIWRAIKPFYFNTTYGAFDGMDVMDEGLKARMLESMKIQVRAMGWMGHPILGEEVNDSRAETVVCGPRSVFSFYLSLSDNEYSKLIRLASGYPIDNILT